MRLIRDSRQKPSWSHTLAVPSVIALTASFLLGGVDLTVGTVHLVLASRSGAEYALMIAPFLGHLGFREYVEKKTTNGGA